MATLVSRTCTRALDDGRREPSRPLEAFRDNPAYVLLGEPGAGKTTEFEQEARRSDGHYCTVRDFLDLGPGPQWRGGSLFIDGLDESRAGDGGGTALNQLRARLNELGRPPFRLSCREADWYATDETDLTQVSPDGHIAVLHLDDLEDTQVRAILTENHGIADAENFVTQARAHRLDDLLRNPQTLKLLAEALADGRWPASRAETYQLACERLATEPNSRHRHARAGRGICANAVLEAAGHLCAIQLLAGLVGFAQDGDAADPAYVNLDELSLPETAAVARALTSRLFMQGERDEQRRPVHRSVAEYLAARWLAARIDNDKMPLVRVLALMTGMDGGVVTSLRGLHAWLAVHCLSARGELIDRDPLGVVLYGDARGFPREDKRRLLFALQAEAARYPWFRASDWQTSPFGVLGTAEMAGDFADILASTARHTEHQVFLGCVLDAAVHGEPLPVLADGLMSVVRDSTYWSRIRESALRGYMHATVTGGDTLSLRQLIAGIQTNVVEDQDDELLGLLLDRLYPSDIAACELIAYLHRPKASSLSGNYVWFWSHRLVEKERPQDLPALMDALVADRERLRLRSDDFRLQRIIEELLVRTVESQGDAIAPERLFAWLDFAFNCDSSGFSWMARSGVDRIRLWIGNHADLYRALVRFGVLSWQNQTDFRQRMFLLQHRLLEAERPAGFAEWCLHQAEAAVSEEAAHWLFDEACNTLVRRQGWEGFPLDVMSQWVESRPRFQPWLANRLQVEVQESYLEMSRHRLRHHEAQMEERERWLRYVRDHYRTIADGSAHPKVFNDLAMIYWGIYHGAQGDRPWQRLSSVFAGDESLVQVILTGLQRTLDRNDLQRESEIIDLAVKGQEFLIGEACLAGAGELFAADPSGFLALDEQVLRRLITFHLVSGYGETPDWFSRLAHARADLIAQGLSASVPAMIRAGKEYVAGVNLLADDPEYKEVARLAVPTLLDRFPLRVKKGLRKHLELLLIAGLRYLDDGLLIDRINGKLALSSLDSGQRMLWLSAALVVDPCRYEVEVTRLVESSQTKAALLVDFLRRFPDEHSIRKPLTQSMIALLIRVLGPTCTPTWRSAGFSGADKTAIQVGQFIDRLAGRPDAEAQSALEQLLAEQPLAAWHERLRQALESQRLTRREVLFRPPEARQVVEALKNRGPANVADLRALVLDHLEWIAGDLRHGNTNGWRAYWDGDRPCLENDCRDRLLERLRPRLEPLGVEAEKEGYFARDKRADIRVSLRAGTQIVPVEIKRDSHRELWRALREQLIARYTPDPAARGNGIYLVFWFGGKGLPMPPNGDPRPRSAEDLRKALLAQLNPQERRVVAVVVIDCSQPPT